ncbi:unnamed protein product, partial [Staurois parvus]
YPEHPTPITSDVKNPTPYLTSLLLLGKAGKQKVQEDQRTRGGVESVTAEC